MTWAAPAEVQMIREIPCGDAGATDGIHPKDESTWMKTATNANIAAARFKCNFESSPPCMKRFIMHLNSRYNAANCATVAS